MTEETPASPGVSENESPGPASGGTSPLAALSRDAAELIEYASCYFGAAVDRGKLSLRDLLWKVVAGIVAVAAACGLVASAAAFLLYGASLGLAEILGGRIWLGCLIVGAAFLALAFLLIQWGRSRSRRSSLKKMRNDYERTLDEQRARFGSDVEQRSEAVVR